MARNDRKLGPEQPEIDARLIRDLAKLLDETGLTEIEIETDGRRLKVARQAAPVAPMAMAPVSGGMLHSAPAIAGPASSAKTEEMRPADPGKHPGAVTSPMVGTAFLAPDPNSALFVKVGDTVTKGQTLLIIDAMKTMNPIPSPRAGKVTQVLIGNAQPVEYGQALMIIE